MASVDFLLFQRMKEDLTGLSLDGSSLKKLLEGVIRTINIDEFVTALRQCRFSVFKHCRQQID